MYQIPYEQLKAFYEDAFYALGFAQSDSAFITDVLLAADLSGIASHGTQRTSFYKKLIEDGFINIKASPAIVHQTPISLVIDADKSMGQLVSRFAMNKAIEKAQESGICLVAVRNSNHFGIARYYSKMAAKLGYMGICMTNSMKATAPTFGRDAMLGTNPISLSLPASPYPFDFDAATSVVAYGKIEVYAKKGQEMPPGWAVGKDGQDALLPQKFLDDFIREQKGGIYALGGRGEEFGGHKGFGFSMICEIFCSVLSGGLTSNHVDAKKPECSHFFGVINLGVFGDAKAILRRLERYLEEMRASTLMPGESAIYTPGQKSTLSKERHLKEGVPVLEASLNEMRELAKRLNFSFEKYFPKL